MNPGLPLLLTALTCLGTLLGGAFALKFKDRLHLILSFSAGAVLGVAFFDLLPESLHLLASNDSGQSQVCLAVALGFSLYLFLSTWIDLHPSSESAHEEDCENPHHRGTLGAASFSFHSLLDGIAIGLAFKAGYAVGVIVAVAVLAHDFSDGINTVGVVLRAKGTVQQAKRWLILDGIAPMIGCLLTLFIHVDSRILGLSLAVFCGFFLFIGAADLLPESHHDHPGFTSSAMTLLGLFMVYIAVQFAKTSLV